MTNAHESMCGGYLPVNKELLITGIQSNNLMKKVACIFFLIQLSLFARFEEVHWKEKFKDTKDVTNYYILPMIVSGGQNYYILPMIVFGGQNYYIRRSCTMTKGIHKTLHTNFRHELCKLTVKCGTATTVSFTSI